MDEWDQHEDYTPLFPASGLATKAMEMPPHGKTP
jgi:hypothetical protein